MHKLGDDLLCPMRGLPFATVGLFKFFYMNILKSPVTTVRNDGIWAEAVDGGGPPSTIAGFRFNYNLEYNVMAYYILYVLGVQEFSSPC